MLNNVVKIGSKSVLRTGLLKKNPMFFHGPSRDLRVSGVLSGSYVILYGLM